MVQESVGRRKLLQGRRDNDKNSVEKAFYDGREPYGRANIVTYSLRFVKSNSETLYPLSIEVTVTESDLD